MAQDAQVESPRQRGLRILHSAFEESLNLLDVITIQSALLEFMQRLEGISAYVRLLRFSRSSLTYAFWYFLFVVIHLYSSSSFDPATTPTTPAFSEIAVTPRSSTATQLDPEPTKTIRVESSTFSVVESARARIRCYANELRKRHQQSIDEVEKQVLVSTIDFVEQFLVQEDRPVSALTLLAHTLEALSSGGSNAVEKEVVSKALGSVAEMTKFLTQGVLRLTAKARANHRTRLFVETPEDRIYLQGQTTTKQNPKSKDRATSNA